MNLWAPLAAATLGWAMGAVLTRAVLLDGVDTFTLVPLRMAFAMATLGIVIVATKRFGSSSRRAWKRGLVLGTVSMALPMVLITLSLEDLPVSLGGLLIALIPMATIAAAHFLVDGERFVARSLPGLLLALAGTVLLVGVGGNSIQGVDNLWRGLLFITAGVMLAGVGGALSRRFALEVPSSQLVLPQFTFNTLTVFAITPLLGGTALGTISGVDWLLIAITGTLGTTVPFAAFLFAAGHNPASRLALVGYTVPVAAVALAVIFLGEILTPAVIAGAALIIGGVVLAERPTGHVPEAGVTTAR